jgi:hypothetical protein
MLIYYKILQIHAKIDSIILPKYIVENKEEQFTNKNTTSHTRTTESEFWKKIYSEEDNNRLNKNPNSTVIFQIYFLISSLHTFKMNENHLQKKTNTKTKIEQWIHHKYTIVYKTIITNIFITSENKAEIAEIFYKTQRTYLALKKFFHIYFFKKAQIKINSDLCLNVIDPSYKNTFIVVQNKAKYMFTSRDILNLTMTSLKTHDNFFSEPHKPRNPYTNIPFTTADLYNIYFHISNSSLITPPLLTECFLNNFDMERFLVNNETKLRDFSINNYILNSPHTMLYNEVMYMIRYHFIDTQIVEYTVKNPNSKRTNQIIKKKVNVKLEINPEFPREILIDTMRPYLYLYFISNNHIHGTEKRTFANKILQYTIRKFMRYNSKFGRKIITVNKETILNPFTQQKSDSTNKYKKTISEFNTSHEIFTVFQAEEMLSTNHLIKCSENISIQILPTNNDDDEDDDDADADTDADDDDDDDDNDTIENENILQGEFVENIVAERLIIDNIDPPHIFLPYPSENEST